MASPPKNLTNLRSHIALRYYTEPPNDPMVEVLILIENVLPSYDFDPIEGVYHKKRKKTTAVIPENPIQTGKNETKKRRTG